MLKDALLLSYTLLKNTINGRLLIEDTTTPTISIYLRLCKVNTDINTIPRILL